MNALFIGTESYAWTTQDFLQACSRAKNNGIDTLFVKVADGSHIWYGGLTGVMSLLHLMHQQGIDVVPYQYCYGGATLQSEVAIANALLTNGYIPCLDIESEWLGQIAWCTWLVKNLYAAVYVTTWANVVDQSWQALMPILSTATKSFLPQIYTPYLYQVWQTQYETVGIGTSRCIPIFALGSIPLMTEEQKQASYALWEYGQLTDATLHSIAHITQDNVHRDAQAYAAWKSSEQFLNSGTPTYDTGIAKSWLALYQRGFYMGVPLTQEYSTVNWAGLPIVTQQFSNARAEYDGTEVRWYQ